MDYRQDNGFSSGTVVQILGGNSANGANDNWGPMPTNQAIWATGGVDPSEPREASEEEELMELEEEVNKMALKILEYRSTLPDQLTSTLSSILMAQRPVFPVGLANGFSGQETQVKAVPNSEAGPSRGASAIGECNSQEEAEKIELLKQKISSNSSTLPVVLKRVKDYMTRIDKLESSSEFIHPAFKRKRIS